MKKLFIILVPTAIILYSIITCDYQKQEAKTKEEITRYSVNCVKSFIEKVYKQKDSGKDLCFAFTLPNGEVTLYDAATELGVKWNPDEVNIQKNVELVCDSNNILKFVEVTANYHGKKAIFRVGFDIGLVDYSETMNSSLFAGSKGSTVILDSEGFLPNKTGDEEKKQHIKFSFKTQNDMINYMLSKEAMDYNERAALFLKEASYGKLNYRDSEKRGNQIGERVLTDSIKTAKLIGFEYGQDLKSVIKTISKEGVIELYTQPCHLIYTNNVGVYMKKYAYDSEGVVDWNSCWKYLFRSSDGVRFALSLNIDEKTDIELFDIATESLKDQIRFEENRRLINELEQRNQY